MKFRQKIAFSLLLYIVVCSAAFAQVVHFPDPNLRAAILEALDIVDCPDVQLDAPVLRFLLKDLNAGNRGISDLSGLEHATSLTLLLLHNNAISDLRPLSPLVNLTSIRLLSNQISDISPLANLTELTRLLLGDNNITDIGPLVDLTQLTTLDLASNNITDISPLANLTELTTLLLGGNNITDTMHLGDLAQLTTLNLGDNNITDIRHLGDLTQLTTLNLGWNNITDIGSLANLTELTHLALRDNNITDVTPLANLTNLKRLELQNNRITDITPLEKLTNLEYLNTQNNPIFDTDSPVVDIPDLNLRAVIRQTLEIDAPAITREDMLRLTELEAERQNIADLSGLEHATSLTSLKLHNNAISDLRPLSPLVNLTSIRLLSNQISDISPLANLTELTTLLLGDNNITDITPLVDLTHLTTLDLASNNITDISPLANLTGLTHLALRDNTITDVTPLANLANLKRLELQNNRITDITPLEKLTNLEHLNTQNNNTQNNPIFDANSTVVHIPDFNLRAIIRRTLEIDAPAITREDMLRLTRLEAERQNIANLTGLEHATSLTLLLLHDNAISDLRPLSPLVKLTSIRLLSNQISDISPLANLTELTTLLLGDNNIRDIRPLVDLSQLTTLDLASNNIADISPLANLTGLTHLALRDNTITDVTPLANLTNLKRLELQNNRITDITPLEKLTNLEHLDTQNNPILDADSPVVDSPVVDIPDPNLRSAIHDALGLDRFIITQADMLRLGALPAERRGITDLTGIEYALNLNNLGLQGNNITNLAPLASLKTLEYLFLSGNKAGNNSITDISPLSSLTRLKRLYLDFNRISDIRPLADLTALTHLGLAYNTISDVNPLAGLYNLEILHIHNNSIADHSPLDGLALSLFEYDQSCDIPPKPLAPRLENRSFPSIFAPISTRLENKAEELLRKYPDYWDRRIAEGAYHDLIPSDIMMFQQEFVEIDNEWHVYGLMPLSIELRDRFHAMNPNTVFIAGVSNHDTGDIDTFPDDHPYWLRDANGEIALKNDRGWRLINFAHPTVQDIIVGQALAVARCGLYDGIFFDWWDDSSSTVGDLIPLDIAIQARINIVRRIRESTRPNFIMMGNVNHRIMPLTGPFMNSGYMESSVFQGHTGEILEARLTRVENSLRWLEQNLGGEPTINALQGGSDPNEYPDSPKNRRYMRATTTLSLTHSDGYVVFSIDHHDYKYWYDFWDADLGQPVGPKSQLYDEDIPGLYIREFTNGWAVYNHSGASQVITLPEEAQGVASGIIATEHALADIDGEMYLRVKPKNPADVNGDSVVNILDLVVVAQGLGTDNPEADVNRDGMVNILDLVQVAGALGGDGAAPSASSLNLSIISAADVAAWLAQAQSLGAVDANFQRGIRFLQQLLAALTPKETALLPNYPNPFNPETWIPYRLAREAEVAITIYDTQGAQVRRLALGNQAAGYYAERGKAAYWDGRNEDGEAVASGIYFYQFRAGDYAASRRMIILK